MREWRGGEGFKMKEWRGGEVICGQLRREPSKEINPWINPWENGQIEPTTGKQILI